MSKKTEKHADNYPEDYQLAKYTEEQVTLYAGNPLIEALPPILTKQQAYQALKYLPEYDSAFRELPDEIRLHLIFNANQFVQPNANHIELESKVGILIRSGYLGRNPTTKHYWRDMDERVNATKTTKLPKRIKSKAIGLYLVGFSGIGKTTAIETVLDIYPQVIVHKDYEKSPFCFIQIVWLKLDCPFDGSIKALCKNFFQSIDEILGTNYLKEYTKGRPSTDDLIGAMKRLTGIHGIGCLVIDEIQHLSAAKSQGVEKMLNFFVEMVNKVSTPVILIGTYKAIGMLKHEFRSARRGSSVGDMLWERMKEDKVWDRFVEKLWGYQFVKKEEKLTKELSHALYEVSQGITDFAVKTYLLAQMRAITSGEESITPGLLRSVATDSFYLTNEVLLALKEKDWNELAKFEDIAKIDFELHYKRMLVASRAETNRIIEEIEEEGANQSGSSSAAEKPRIKLKDLREVHYDSRKPLAPYEMMERADILKSPGEFYEMEGK